MHGDYGLVGVSLGLITDFIMKRTGIAVLFLMIASPFNPLQSQEESAVIDSTSIKQEINH